jgi:acetolactate synthase regulatory subunit
MSVKFKIADDAPEARVEQVLEALRGRGFVAERMFPGQQRAKLARIFVIRSGDAQAAEVANALERFGADVEYVEGAVTRKVVGLGTDPP